ncbi:MAG: DEAD/DEAH box helicase [Methanomassiliicoccales archaeon]
MVFELLDERIQAILSAKNILEPTEPQKGAIPLILRGAHVLVVAPTGIGKTEAAILPVFHQILKTGGDGILCLYITPLRALNRDMLRRFQEFSNTLGISIAVRHGDTSQSERDAQARIAPQVLITTPETLQILFTGKRLRKHLANVRWVVIDEIHELATDERGAQLAIALERLVEIAGEFQRIGLSATVGTLSEVANFLGGVGRNVSIVQTDVIKTLDIQVQGPEVSDEDTELAGILQSDPQLVACMRRARQLIDSHRSTLFFVNTRDNAEALAARYHLWDENFPIGVHHGSLSKEIRIEMEEAFKNETIKGLICTSSLELGIDVGSADFAIQYNSPRQVTRLVQRMGRAGHGVGKISKGVIIASSPDEICESLVIARRALGGELEPSIVREKPLSVLANQLVSMAMNSDMRIDDAYRIIKRAYPFRNLKLKEMNSILRQLEQVGLIRILSDTFRRSGRGMRYFYDNVSMIPDEKTYRIRDISTRKIVGTLDESFVVSFAEPYATFITRGRTWRIIELREDEILVEQVKEIGSIPSWVGEDIPVPFEVAQEVGALRKKQEFHDYPGNDEAMKRLKEYLTKQIERHPMPSETLLTLEMGNRIAVLNACFGTKVNETIAIVLSLLLTARLGESVSIRTDPYRIFIELPRDIPPSTMLDTLMSMKAENIQDLVRRAIRQSSFMRWRFIYVAKKFGIVEKGADYRSVNISRLIDVFENTPIYEETVNKIFWEDLDVNRTSEVLKSIERGEIKIEVCSLSPISLSGLEHSRDLITPQRADKSILDALKKRLEGEVTYLTCLNCQNQWRATPREAPKRIVCPRCRGSMIAALHSYNRDLVKLLRKKKHSDDEKKEIQKMYKNASLVNEFGKQAMFVLSARGVGPDTASRILMGFYDNEEDLLRSILSAEINYARTKRFWD